MKVITVTAFTADTMPDATMCEALQRIAIALMDHGSVTLESAAIIRAWKKGREE